MTPTLAILSLLAFIGGVGVIALGLIADAIDRLNKTIREAGGK